LGFPCLQASWRGITGLAIGPMFWNQIPLDGVIACAASKQNLLIIHPNYQKPSKL
jgi:hypothetical protein